MSLVNDHDWENLGEQFRNAEPFPSICIDNFLDPEFARELADSYPSFNDAKNLGMEFKTVNEKRKIQVTNPDHFSAQTQKLADALASEEFRKNIETMSGISNLQWDSTFAGGGMHLTDSSGALDVHVDFNYSEEMGLYRRLNMLIYLNPVWEESWGGAVELWDSDVSECLHSFSPKLNRCVMFATSDHSFHGVTAVQSPEGISRNSFATYYYNEKAAGNIGDLYGGNHGTVFKGRPDEKLKKHVLMPLESVKNTLTKKKEGLKQYIKGKL